jgi:serine protease AprX
MTTGACNATVGSPQYFTLSGTSMATPVVSGAAALMLQKDPTLTPDLLKARMMKSAWKSFGRYASAFDKAKNQYNMQADVFTYGAGYLDIAAALNNTDAGAGSAMSPTAVYNSTTGTVNLQFGNGNLLSGNSILWGSSVLWASSVIWGGGSFVDDGCSILWGASVVWGSYTDDGFSVIWGASVLWGSDANTAFAADDADCTPDDPACVDSTTTSSTTDPSTSATTGTVI